MSYRPLVMTTHHHLSQQTARAHQLPYTSKQEEWRYKGIALLRCSFGAFWGYVAWQTCQQAFRMYLVSASTPGQTLNAWSSFWLHLMSSQPPITSYILAACEACLAFCFIAGAFTNQTAIGGGVFALFLWSTLGGCGLLAGPASTTTGCMLLFLMVLLGLFLSNAGLYYGFDRYFASRAERRTHLNPDISRTPKQPGRSASPSNLSPQDANTKTKIPRTTGQHPAVQRISPSRPGPGSGFKKIEPASSRTHSHGSGSYKNSRYAPM